MSWHRNGNNFRIVCHLCSKQLRDAERDTSQNQPEAAKKLRDALSEMDSSNLDNRFREQRIG